MRQEQKGGYVLQEARILKQKAIQIFFFLTQQLNPHSHQYISN